MTQRSNTRRWPRLIAPLLFLAAPLASVADNPLVSHVYTADPAARVIDGRVYVVVTHDQDDQSDYSELVDYYLFSSDDMVNWRDHGIIWNSQTDSSWANLAYAPDLIERNGRYYLYFPDGANAIGVAVADDPEGPYTDPIGGPLVDRNTPNGNVDWVFDPGVFIDDGGQAYLYFGGGGPGNARVIRLNNDMVGTTGSAISIDAPNFFESLSMNQRNGTYYLTYSTDTAGGLSIDYMTSDNPTDGFIHRGTVLANPWENNNNNNHQSAVEFNGQWYMFYHNRAVSNERGDSTYQRSINVDLLSFGGDGSMQPVNDGPNSVPQLTYVDAFATNQAETFDTENGIDTAPASEGTQNLEMGPGDWVKISGVDFGSGATGMDARVAANIDSGLEILLDDVDSQPIATLQVSNTGGWQSWETQSVAFDEVTGVHDVYLRSTAGHNLNWYRFTGGSGNNGSSSDSSSHSQSSSDNSSSASSEPDDGIIDHDFFVGNITTSGDVRSDFVQYWDQITPENEGKWGSVEATRDMYDWSGQDRAYDYAQEHGIPFKAHTLVWGSQAPDWIDSLSASEQAAEIEEWIRDYCERYPDTEMIDVVNEATPGHAPAGYAENAFGSDWIIRVFELAREHCPDSILILNDYNVLSWNNTEFIEMARPAVEAGVVDALGLQAHGLEDWSLSDLEANLNRVADLGLPLYISEYDIAESNDQAQLQIMREQFPLFHEHPSVVGITLWGYVVGRPWVDGSGLINEDGSPRPAMTWLMDYLGH